jgi:DNA-binding MarR family transcriptional regulator
MAQPSTPAYCRIRPIAVIIGLNIGDIMRKGTISIKDYDLIGLLNQTTETIFRARQKELDQYSISTSQGAVLFITKALGEKATISEISRWLLRKPHTVSEIVSRMEKKGLLKKSRTPKRKSIIKVALTPKGLEVYRKSKKRQSFSNILTSLSLEERQQMVAYLKRLKDSAVEELKNHDETKLDVNYY